MPQAVKSNITSRRSFLGTSIAAAAGLTVGVSAPAFAATPDPIFAAIEMHRATWGEFNARCSDLSDQETDAARTEWRRLWDAQTDAALALCHIEPTTLAGVAGLLRYSVEFVANHNMWPDDFVDDENDDVFKKRPFSFFLERHLADAIETITGTPTASFDTTS